MTPRSGLDAKIVCSGQRLCLIRCRSTPKRLAPTDVSTRLWRQPVEGPWPRAVDLLIAATALANELSLYTRNADDFRFLDGLVDVIAI